MEQVSNSALPKRNPNTEGWSIEMKKCVAGSSREEDGSFLGFNIPPKLDMLLDMPEVDSITQADYGWDLSGYNRGGFSRRRRTPMIHRYPAAQRHNIVSGLKGVKKGLHVWEVHWPSGERAGGIKTLIGVMTAFTTREWNVGVNRNKYRTKDQSWVWDITSCQLFHEPADGEIAMYPAWLKPGQKFEVPEKFLLVVDSDEGTVSFVANGKYLGVAFTGVKGLKLYPMGSCMSGECLTNLKYIGGLYDGDDPLSLMHLSRRAIRRYMGSSDLEERIEQLELPETLKAYLLYEESI